MKARKILFYIFTSIAFAINVLIIVESCIGGEGSASQSISLSESIAHMIESMFPNANIDHAAFHSAIRKIVGHFLLFGLSGIFTCLAVMMNEFLMEKFKWKNIIFIAAFGLLIAVISELIQYFTPGRYGALTDILIDYSGYVLFGGLTYLITFFILRKHKKEEIKNPD